MKASILRWLYIPWAAMVCILLTLRCGSSDPLRLCLCSFLAAALLLSVAAGSKTLLSFLREKMQGRWGALHRGVRLAVLGAHALFGGWMVHEMTGSLLWAAALTAAQLGLNLGLFLTAAQRAEEPREGS